MQQQNLYNYHKNKQKLGHKLPQQKQK